MDTIFITGLQVETVIGVYDWERTIQQTLIFDIEMAADTRLSAADDDLDKTLDYGAIANFITNRVAGSQYKLLEALGNNLSDQLFEHFPLTQLKMKIGKPGAVPNAKSVGIIIERERPQPLNTRLTERMPG